MSGVRHGRRLSTIALGAPASPASGVAVRALDIVVSATLLALCLPLCAVIALAIRAESPGPVLHRSWRAGFRSSPLGVLKFRKMHDGAVGDPLTVTDDPRLTRVGAFLARTHLDELPQLWNVLTGQMSLVGPRPEDTRFTRLHPAAYGEILTVRPGLTGWTQLVWVDECALLSPATDRVRLYVDELLPRKIETDLAYARHRRFGSDLKLLLWTPLVLLLGFGVTLDAGRRELRLRRGRAPVRLRAASELDAAREATW